MSNLENVTKITITLSFFSFLTFLRLGKYIFSLFASSTLWRLTYSKPHVVVFFQLLVSLHRYSSLSTLLLLFLRFLRSIWLFNIDLLNSWLTRFLEPTHLAPLGLTSWFLNQNMFSWLFHISFTSIITLCIWYLFWLAISYVIIFNMYRNITHALYWLLITWRSINFLYFACHSRS